MAKDDSNDRPPGGSTGKGAKRDGARLAEALRANLRRRKEQARGRWEQAPPTIDEPDRKPRRD